MLRAANTLTVVAIVLLGIYLDPTVPSLVEDIAFFVPIGALCAICWAAVLDDDEVYENYQLSLSVLNIMLGLTHLVLANS